MRADSCRPPRTYGIRTGHPRDRLDATPRSATNSAIARCGRGHRVRPLLQGRRSRRSRQIDFGGTLVYSRTSRRLPPRTVLAVLIAGPALVATAEASTLQGRVLDPQGKAVAASHVVVQEAGTALRRETT